MTALRDHIARLISAEGPLSVADYMSLVLTAPSGGYYMRGDPFGARGDFITAPEVSQIFGELIGLWCVEMWQQLGAPSRFTLAELGPGRGTLMRDALRAARVRGAFLDAADVRLVEISPGLRDVQTKTLAGVRVRSLAWADRVEQLPADGPVILIANEFFDALPVRQVVRAGERWHERCVGLDANGHLVFALSPAVVPADVVPAHLRTAPAGSIVEVAPARLAMAETIGTRIKSGGAAIVIDYGYERAAAGDTLQAIKGHGFVDPLAAPGEADVTAHVDFGALAGAFAAGGAVSHGPVPQGDWLERLGARERAQALAARASAEQQAALAQGLARLTAPDQMGSLFKALAAASPGLKPPGFS